MAPFSGLSFAVVLLALTACATSRAPTAVRPAGAAPDTSYVDPVEIMVEGDTLRGEYLVPPGAGPFPLLLLHPGSGGTDRDGNTVGLPDGNNSLLYLARGLAERGVATLRVDKRGIGGSAAAQPAEVDLRFTHYVRDAAAWLRAARADGRFGAVVAGGHSEGGLVAALAAPEAEADGLVLIATLGRPAGVLIREQVQRNAPFLYAQADSTLARIEAGDEDVPSPPGLEALFRPSVQPYLRSLLALDPVEAVSAYDGPVLVVQGTTDLQATVADAEALAEARPGVDLRLIEGMNHVLKAVGGALAAQVPSYTDPSLPLAPGIVEAVAGFALGLDADGGRPPSIRQ